MPELHTMADFARDTIIGVVLAGTATGVVMILELWRNRHRRIDVRPVVWKGQPPNPPPAPPPRPRSADGLPSPGPNTVPMPAVKTPRNPNV